jgi:diguanylate cyclase
VLLASTEVDQAAATLEKALADLGQRNVKLRATDEPLGPITFSAGVAAFGGNDCAAAVQEADALLYQAKEAGRAAVFRAR